MPARQPLPRLWLMTDERQGGALWDALDALPRGQAGIIFRHYHTAGAERRALFERVRAIARRRRLLLVLAGSDRLARAWRADGVHRATVGSADRKLLRTAPAHDRRAAITALRDGADLVLLSPVFPTRSHPGGKALGPVRFGLMARGLPRVVALGGMDQHRARRLAQLGSYGWAAIDALSGKRRVARP